MMPTTRFNGDFFEAVVTVIPIFWLALVVEVRSFDPRDSVAKLRELEEGAKTFGIPLDFDLETYGRKMRNLAFVMGLALGAGVIAEIASFFALALRNPNWSFEVAALLAVVILPSAASYWYVLSGPKTQMEKVLERVLTTQRELLTSTRADPSE